MTGLSRNKAGAGNVSNMLNFLFLTQCVQKDKIENFSGDNVSQQKQDLLQGKKSDGQLYMEWETVINFLEATQENPNKINPAGLGEMMLEFFQTQELSFEKQLPDFLRSIVHECNFAACLENEHLELVREQLHRAYQLLALHGDAQIMLDVSGSEDYKVIFLTPLLSNFVAGVEKSKALEIERKTGVKRAIIRHRVEKSKALEIERKTGVKRAIIRHRFRQSRNSAFLEVNGSEPAIRAVEKELEKMSKQASRDRMSLMSSCFVEGASVLLFEDSRIENDVLDLTPYDGPCHQAHDKLARHVAFVKDPENNGYPLRCFTEKFFQQLQVLSWFFFSL